MMLLNYFSELLDGLKNEIGGCFRPVSGTAMYYLWHVKDINASVDGRKKENHFQLIFLTDRK